MQDLLLLHGALGASAQLLHLRSALESSFTVHTPDFSGHGGRPFPEAGFSIRQFGEEVLAYMDKEGIRKASFFGYSMGGYVAMYLARHHPERVERVATLATKFHWDEASAQKEVRMLDAGKIEAKLPAFAGTLRDRHAPNDWKQVMLATAVMLTGLGADNALKPEDYPSITAPVLVMIGDADKMVSLEETVAVYQALPNARMAMLPGTQHPLEQANEPALVFLLRQFLQG